MCNIAGYVGNRPAAPILIEMLRRQEGLAGGFYSGIATLHGGKLHYAKLTGDVDRLVALTEAARLPGTVGIIHSRSKSGGGDLWAHPFVSEKDGVPVTAYVANGTAGFGRSRSEEYSRLAERLMSEGYAMPSRVVDDNPRYQKLSDGATVHMSDVMCQLIQRNLDRGETPILAFGNAYCEMPSEIVGLLLNIAYPDRIFWSRINYPMTLSFAPHGAYLSSAAMAMPEDRGNVIEIPANSSGEVLSDRYLSVPYPEPPVAVTVVTDVLRAEAYGAVVQALEEPGEKSCSDLVKRVNAVLGQGVTPAAAVVYEILRKLREEGRLISRIRRVEGAVEGIDAPKLYFTQKK